MSIFLVLPVYNEKTKIIDNLLNQISKHVPHSRIILVDDGSKKPINISANIILLRHDINLGKGAALKTGIDYAFKKGATAVIMMDSDGQHDPKEIPLFIKYINQGYDLVFGSRRPRLDAPLIRLLGNKFASIYMNLVFGVYVSDVLSGFRGFTKKTYNLIRWKSPHYGVETEMIARLGRQKDKIKFVEFPIETIYIDKYKGVTILDAVKILFSTLWWKLS